MRNFSRMHISIQYTQYFINSRPKLQYFLLENAAGRVFKETYRRTTSFVAFASLSYAIINRVVLKSYHWFMQLYPGLNRKVWFEFDKSPFHYSKSKVSRACFMYQEKIVLVWKYWGECGLLATTRKVNNTLQNFAFEKSNTILKYVLSHVAW